MTYNRALYANIEEVRCPTHCYHDLMIDEQQVKPGMDCSTIKRISSDHLKR